MVKMLKFFKPSLYRALLLMLLELLLDGLEMVLPTMFEFL